MAHILIAEDEPVIQKALKDTLTKKGHSVLLTRNGRMAYELLLDNPDFDILISDVIMPDMDGKQLVSNIRKEQSLVELPVILISGHIPINEVMSILELGQIKFMPKPINLQELLDTVADFSRDK